MTLREGEVFIILCVYDLFIPYIIFICNYTFFFVVIIILRLVVYSLHYLFCFVPFYM